MAQPSAALPPRLTRAVEASLARFVRGLFFPLSTDGGYLPDDPVDLGAGLAGKGADRPLFAVLAPILSRGVWQFLARNGGYRRIDAILAGGKKKPGRLWDVWGSEPLRIGAPTVHWLSFLHDHLSAAPLRAGSSPVPALDAGDRLAVSIALLPILSDTELAERLPAEVRDLAARTPLLALAVPTLLPESGATFTLDDPQESLALQYLDDFLAGAWTVIALPTRRRPVAMRASLDAALRRSLEALFAAATCGDRDHHLVPVARFYPTLWRAAGGAEAIQQAIESTAQQLSLQSARETFLAGYGGVLRFGVQLEDRVHAIQQTPWADRTESQKRLAAEYEAWYRPVAAEVRLLFRRLTREVG